MGPNKEPKEKIAEGPGPGAYGTLSQNRTAPRSKALKRNGFGSAKRKSFGEEAAKTCASPGPGVYFPPKEWYRGKPFQNSSFGASERRSMALKSASPGPATYVMKSTLTGPKWTTTTRGVEVLETEGDGPGMYTLPSTLQKRSCTLAGKPSGSFEKGAEGPAPGAYNLEGGSKSKYRGPKFGSATRDPAEDVEHFEYPGPGWYRPKYDYGKERIPEASMGRGPRAVGLGSKATGVGSARPWFLDGPCCDLNMPGPESYETAAGFEGPKISISVKLDDAGVRGFEPALKMKVPGPGAYDPSFAGGETEAHQQSMGNLARSVNVDKGEGPARPWYLEASYSYPGPSTYRPERYDKNKVGSEGPTGPRYGASIKARMRQGRPPDETPGPGAHGPAATCIGC